MFEIMESEKESTEKHKERVIRLLKLTSSDKHTPKEAKLKDKNSQLMSNEDIQLYDLNNIELKDISSMPRQIEISRQVSPKIDAFKKVNVAGKVRKKTHKRT